MNDMNTYLHGSWIFSLLLFPHKNIAYSQLSASFWSGHWVIWAIQVILVIWVIQIILVIVIIFSTTRQTNYLTNM